MTLYNAFALLLVLAAGFAYLNHRFLHLPSTIGLMVLSLLLSLLLVGLGKLGVVGVLDVGRLVGQIDFDQVLMQLMLSFLLFAGALHTDARRLHRLRWSVGVLALVGTLISTGFVAAAMYLVLPLLGLPLAFVHCLLFGALISPTDPVAVLGILTKANIPKSLEIKIVGESLFNDGVGVVVFVSVLRVAQAGAGSFEAGQVLLLFLQEAGGGLLLGAALGRGGAWLLRSVDDYQVETLLTLALVVGGTALAGLLHTSWPLAMVVAGLLIGHYARTGTMSDTTLDYVNKFWELTDGVLNALLFALMGLQLLVLKLSWPALWAGLAAVVVVLLARLVAVAVPLGLLPRRPGEATPHRLPVLVWGGLRGGISVALALSVPAAGPRDLLIGITYVVVVFSIIGQGLTIAPLVRRLGIARPAEDSSGAATGRPGE